MLLVEQRLQLGAQIPLQQHHQRADLGGRALPVLDRERVQRQHLDAETRGGLDRVAHGVDAGAMASTRGRWRCAAQRPLPSMMMAMCAGSRSKLICRTSIRPDGRPESTPGARHATRGMSLGCKHLIIVHANEEQTVRRRGRARVRARAPGEQLRHRCHRPPSTADLHERPDNRAHHMTKEAVTGDFIQSRIADPRVRQPFEVRRSRIERSCGCCWSHLCRRSGTRRSRGCPPAMPRPRASRRHRGARTMPHERARERIADLTGSQLYR